MQDCTEFRPEPMSNTTGKQIHMQTKASSRAATKLSGRIVNCSCYEI